MSGAGCAKPGTLAAGGGQQTASVDVYGTVAVWGCCLRLLGACASKRTVSSMPAPLAAVFAQEDEETNDKRRKKRNVFIDDIAEVDDEEDEEEVEVRCIPNPCLGWACMHGHLGMDLSSHPPAQGGRSVYLAPCTWQGSPVRRGQPMLLHSRSSSAA